MLEKTTPKSRVESELHELKEKFQKLNVFVSTDNKFASLPQQQRDLLARQQEVMSEYIDILSKRLSLM